jgi:hypothetical protein
MFSPLKERLAQLIFDEYPTGLKAEDFISYMKTHMLTANVDKQFEFAFKL